LDISNNTDRPVRVPTDAHGCRVPWTVELTNASVPVGPPPTPTGCQPALVLTPGDHLLRLSVSTTYPTCSAHPVGREVACLPGGGPPPLPPGTYQAVVVPAGAFPPMTPGRVQLVAARP
jgi:hypothetical protein